VRIEGKRIAVCDDADPTARPQATRAQLADAEGKPRYRFHDLRHTCISRLVAADAASRYDPVARVS
jgi:hypothetical protein